MFPLACHALLAMRAVEVGVVVPANSVRSASRFAKPTPAGSRRPAGMTFPGKGAPVSGSVRVMPVPEKSPFAMARVGRLSWAVRESVFV